MAIGGRRSGRSDDSAAHDRRRPNDRGSPHPLRGLVHGRRSTAACHDARGVRAGALGSPLTQDQFGPGVGRAVVPHVRPTPAYPALRLDDNIQGNILAGFNKDRQVFLFVQLGALASAQRYVREVTAKVATNASVAAFNEQFGAARRLLGGADPASMTATWVSFSITARGLEVLEPDAFRELAERPATTGVRAFLAGAAARANQVGDVSANDPQRWLFGRPGQRIDIIVTIAADRPEALALEIQRQREVAARNDAVVAFEQYGATLPEMRRGHEHFGFRDAISQPGVHGFDSPSQSRLGEVEGKPGTVLVPPGEFVLGYEPAAGGGSASVPRWMWDGSFVAIRRLAQDVPGWWGHLGHTSAHATIPVETLAARAMGRWRSGSPVDADPARDAGPSGGRNNDFDYGDDMDGVRTMSIAHIRAMNPRRSAPADRPSPRLLRRGIPFGPHFDPAAGPGHGADADRGLLFVSYQSNIAQQFETLYRLWSESHGAVGRGPTQTRVDLSPSFRPFVRTQGGVYAFTPSLSTLHALGSGDMLI